MNQNHWSDELSTFHKKRQKKVQRLGLCKKVEPNFSKKKIKIKAGGIRNIGRKCLSIERTR